ncbi:FtsX-like permease family protein [Ginsengibacter hankyongi]|uniref:FtsX-like permease family protein n=1 Tax=Ginsengibacter hankyongi TaxID=2607284 RepID=A0A5J5IB23_9BACT|nr:ABC transporter permease [Ginsengibacter hankyongi]KAA9035470.1 FtsX-like permease family protein [Ginsengibacter hankyongi]
MIKNYFKIAWRNLFRNKGFSLTNLLGLTIGMTCAILIFLWVKDELSYNKSQKNYNEIYKIMANRNFNNQIFTDPSMVLPLAEAIENNIPQIKHAVVTTYPSSINITYGEMKLKKTGYTVSTHFFDVFSVKFIEGNAARAIADPSSIVLTQSAAKAIFGNADPINKVVKIDNNHNAKVTAVVADMPGNTTMQFGYIIPFNYSNEDVKHAMTEWVNSSWQVYVQTLPGANIAAIEKRINAIKYQHDPNDKKISTYFAFPMSRWRLYSDFKDGKNVGGMIEYVRMFTIIAIIILLIACVNFMNLSTARSEKRAKEVGIRKTLGSGKKQLVLQFFFESIILTFISFAFSILAVYLLLPSFNVLVDKQLALDIAQPVFWLGALAIILFTGVVAGSYPALYLSSFNPVKVLKGTFVAGKNAVLPRHVLIVLQFIISILLISGTIIVYQQINLIKNRDVGYNPNNLITIPGTDDTQKNFTVIKQELLQTGMINSVTRTMSPITEVWWKSPSPDWEGKPANTNMIFSGLTTDNDFVKTMGIKMIEGKDFSGTPADSSSMLLNKAAVEAMGLKNPIGMKMHSRKDYTVIGVTDNIVMESPFKPVDPMMIYYNPENSGFISIRLNNGVQPQKALASIETIFKKYNPAYSFEYQFVDKEFGKKFLAEELISRLSNIFAALAIFICCIGLAGLAAFTIEKRIREIGIRKVLGASVQQLLLLISKEFLKLVLIAFVIAVPLTWWFMHNWLQKYEYRTTISVWMFTIVGLVIMALTLIVVSINTMSAALRNPIKSLRTE